MDAERVLFSESWDNFGQSLEELSTSHLLIKFSIFHKDHIFLKVLLEINLFIHKLLKK
jgi:hypothetical protein